ncbi:hypothetical protein SDRG_10288 [Saprolegnia diclina VS20]|uniref:Uncharacterized protein n=1 Tax=Saprolegnia diclina (strain VS20) TaxID=1156394 RepID=T0RQ07_SAPDV|nr:hypothetical protein SDRG_10288 [Saprolegnia diclina VS20]EQC32092.1 hypothetical protein SDRG_10288 [Saprolegnia diclina VS20]|eukprot:XP_008614494.1 hypothetical protein SDRG_10288 [Saprolegnia diclina VS20]
MADLEKLRLKVEPQPPAFPFVGEPFDITVYMVDEAGDLKTGLQVPLQLRLLAGEKPLENDQDLIVVDASTPAVVDGSGICKLRMTVHTSSAAHQSQPFQLEITPADSGIAPVFTSAMTVVQHHLVVQDALPDVWYKDEGSRDKCLEIAVHLVDHTGARVKNRPLPLTMTLLYESGVVVFKQDILKVSPESERGIDVHGRALLRVRIEDVSRNHQSQPFRLKIEPTESTDVAPDITSAITVRSKRNKRPAQQTSEATIADLVSAEDSCASSTESPPRKRHCRDERVIPPSLSRVLQWTRSVLKGFEALEWQQVGYETHVDGSLDYRRPLYRCPACWRYKDMLTYSSQHHAPHCVIANALLTYATETVYDYEALLQQLQPATEPPTETRSPSLIVTYEEHVFCIVAQLAVLSAGACVGFPAFDSAFSLVGFYQAVTTTTTSMVFCPLASVPSLTRADVDRLEMSTHHALFELSPALFRLDAFGGDLEKLKERALLYFWESNLVAA